MYHSVRNQTIGRTERPAQRVRDLARASARSAFLTRASSRAAMSKRGATNDIVSPARTRPRSFARSRFRPHARDRARDPLRASALGLSTGWTMMTDSARARSTQVAVTPPVPSTRCPTVSPSARWWTARTTRGRRTCTWSPSRVRSSRARTKTLGDRRARRGRSGRWRREFSRDGR